MKSFATVALTLCRRVDLGLQQLFHLVDVGLSNFQSEGEIVSPLFSRDGVVEATATGEEILLRKTGELLR